MNINETFSQPLLHWFDHHGRKDLPWQHPRSPYRVWISEIMLQQTQVKTVIPYFNRFMDRFFDINALASASEDEILSYWSGLGYYSRARNLQKTAEIIITKFGGDFPNNVQQLVQLPGIGPSTAAAIASLAFGKKTAILDGNVKRVLSRYFLVEGEINKSRVHKELEQLANDCMPANRCADYTQAIMDLGATCCTRTKPDCLNCPFQTTCMAHKNHVELSYPKKTPKKIRPTQYQQFLLLHKTDHTIYLEKRPPVGIWGGLWCLPSISMEECPTQYVMNNYGMHNSNIKDLLNLKHSFSHFHLHIKSSSLLIDNSTQLFETPGRWFSQSELSSLGIAKPVNDIIQHFLNVMA